ncbi:hypothetical protein BS17DRAFT_783732 [Gyrodon lividus]|nr:hypothetical protein BS17DRAFT_783732 [Gyrodon lividus]
MCTNRTPVPQVLNDFDIQVVIIFIVLSALGGAKYHTHDAKIPNTWNVSYMSPSRSSIRGIC